MSRYCSDCKNLNTEKEKCEGCYFCSAKKTFMFANMNSCDKFEKSYGRNNQEKNDLYNKGKEASKKSEDITPYVVGLVILVIISLLYSLLN